jgi:hypothetical protein
VDEDVSPAPVEYCYRLQDYNEEYGFYSDCSSTVCATAGSYVPEDLRAELYEYEGQAACDVVALEWESGISPEYYLLNRDGDTIATLDGSARSFVDYGVCGGGEHYYWLGAYMIDDEGMEREESAGTTIQVPDPMLSVGDWEYDTYSGDVQLFLWHNFWDEDYDEVTYFVIRESSSGDVEEMEMTCQDDRLECEDIYGAILRDSSGVIPGETYIYTVYATTGACDDVDTYDWIQVTIPIQ